MMMMVIRNVPEKNGKNIRVDNEQYFRGFIVTFVCN